MTRAGLARLKDAQIAANSLEGRFDLAYNAAHALSLAALRHCGYRAANRYIVFQVLPQPLRLGPEVWRVLNTCHQIYKQTRQDRRRIKELERELHRKDRALAETAALLVLSKKVAAIFNTGEDA